jgi:spermidine/putrescine transport system substrate-binding protein
MNVRRACLSTALLATLPGAALTQEINALVWCDHSDPALLEPFEEATGITVNVKEYEGTGAALATLEQSQPGDWDVLVIDAIDVPRVVDAGLMAELPADQLPTANFFPEVVMADSTTRDGKTYAVTEKFGYNAVAYNADAVDPADMQSFDTILSDKYSGRIAIYDYYLPVIGLAAVDLGLDTQALTADDLPAIRDELFRMKDHASSVGEVVASQTAIATGEADIVIGGGEFLTAVLSQDQPSLSWTIPDKGAVVWAQSIGVLQDSANPEAALEFVKYIVSPEGQARLATSSCYWGMPANQQAGEHLTDEQKSVLRWDDQAAYLQRAQLYPAPDADLDAQMQDLWLEMVQR